ncbi:hypothetical protein [Candidatus Laterigemmans baculatus]|uniref:hypothetical protein n=1 Tax=Candidatus Laterigemmans baculatus TaxID=2770505 RepID=UPI0013DA7AFC|nr:hypothetical protein [Candidatus Laterigemmans baculatus]
MIRTTIRWLLLLSFLVAWPIAVTMYVMPALSRLQNPWATASAAELQMLMGVRRYTLEIPQSKDGWMLELTGFVDGKKAGGGGSTVQGGSTVVLLLERTADARLDYCWYADTQVMHGSLPNPFLDAGVTTERGQGPAEPGDWLIRGGRHRVSGDGPADFELRVTLSPPKKEALATTGPPSQVVRSEATNGMLSK